MSRLPFVLPPRIQHGSRGVLCSLPCLPDWTNPSHWIRRPFNLYDPNCRSPREEEEKNWQHATAVKQAMKGVPNCCHFQANFFVQRFRAAGSRSYIPGRMTKEGKRKKERKGESGLFFWIINRVAVQSTHTHTCPKACSVHIKVETNTTKARESKHGYLLTQTMRSAQGRELTESTLSHLVEWPSVWQTRIYESSSLRIRAYCDIDSQALRQLPLEEKYFYIEDEGSILWVRPWKSQCHWKSLELQIILPKP